MVNKCYAGFLNLDHRTDRLEHMTAELNRIDLKAIRHRGKLPQEFDLNRPELQVMRNRTPGAIGCHFGQVEIIRTAQSMGLHAMVFEDDCVFCSDFNERLEIIEMFHVEHEWDIIWLGAAFHINPPHWHPIGASKMAPNCSAQLGRDAETTTDPSMIRTFGAYNTFAYIVNVKSIDKILGLLDQYLHESIGIDWLFIKLQPQLKCFAFVPGCVKQMDNQSDIGNGPTIWSGHLRNGPYVWQDKMEQFSPESFDWAEAKL